MDRPKKSENNLRIHGNSTFNKPLDEFSGNTSVLTWFDKLECYLEKYVNTPEWFSLAFLWTKPECLEDLPRRTEFTNDLAGYNKFKEAMINKYGKQDQQKIRETVELTEFTNRIQREDESITSYGNALIDLAGKIFEESSTAKVEDYLKHQFARGILNPSLEEKVSEKILKMRGQPFSFKQLLEYVNIKEKMRNENAKLTMQLINRQPNTYHNDNHTVDNKHLRSKSMGRQSNLSSSDNRHPQQYQQQYCPPQSFNYQQNQAHHRSTSKFRPQRQQNQPYSNQQQQNQSLSNQQQQNNRSNNGTQSINKIYSATGPKDPALFGLAILNNTLVEYLYDSGAVTTIISEETYNLIKAQDPKTHLKTYRGRSLYSANKKMTILGTVRFRKCIFSPQLSFRGLIAIVCQDLKGDECLLGRNWQRRIPPMKDTLDSMSLLIEQYSKGVKEIYDLNKYVPSTTVTTEYMSTDGSQSETPNSDAKISQTIIEEQNSEKCEALREKDNSNQDNILDIVSIPETSETSESDLLVERRKELQELLSTCSARSIEDLQPQQIDENAFQIRFRDPNQAPITCKSRPIPYHLKERVKIAIQDQLDAKIIRPSRSAWSAALRIVDNPGKPIRITVDYKPLNRVILVDQYPIPFVSDLYAMISKTKFYSKIDMKSAYHQIPMHPDSIEYTAFRF